MLPSLPFKERFTSSRQLLPGGRMNAYSDMLTSSSQIAAFAGGGQAGATPITTAFVDVTTVANANDSVLLPPAQVGLRIIVTNDGAAAMNVYPNGTDTAGTVGPGVPHQIVAAASAEFICNKVGSWKIVALV